jgi:hypothetical protein
MTDTRHPWEIAVSIRLQTAAAYLALLDKPQRQQEVYAWAFHAEGEFEQWVKDHAKAQIDAANKKAAGRDCAVPCAALPFVARLRAMGLDGNVQSVGGIRTNAAAPGAIGGAGEGE